MNDWRGMALEKFPSLKLEIEESLSAVDWWPTLYSEFVQAHYHPEGDAFISKTYEYAFWCLAEEPNGDLANDAILSFFERLPDDPRVYEEMSKWVSREDFEGMNEIYRYGRTEEEFLDLIQKFYSRSEQDLSTPDKPLSRKAFVGVSSRGRTHTK